MPEFSFKAVPTLTREDGASGMVVSGCWVSFPAVFLDEDRHGPKRTQVQPFRVVMID